MSIQQGTPIIIERVANGFVVSPHTQGPKRNEVMVFTELGEIKTMPHDGRTSLLEWLAQHFGDK